MIAPYIKPILPAFAGSELQIEFQHSPFQNNVLSGDICLDIYSLGDQKLNDEVIQSTYQNNIVTFNIADLQPKLAIGQRYKIQLYYPESQSKSDIAIIKYTAIPKIEIIEPTPKVETYADLSTITNLIDQTIDHLTFQYSNEDNTEALFSYKIYITNYNQDKIYEVLEDKQNIVNAGGSFIVSNMPSYYSEEEETKSLYIEGTTINGYKFSIIKNINTGLPTSYTVNNSDIVSIYGDTENSNITIKINKGQIMTNWFYLLRANSAQQNMWTKIAKINIDTTSATSYDIKIHDYLLEDGESYRYLLVQPRVQVTTNNYYAFSYVGYNINLNSPQKAYVENMVLSDSERALVIKYNPQVSSFKTIVQEQKIDTIGSQYPFFFKNGNVNYKEFPIQGLISYLQDDAELFMTKAELELSSGLVGRGENITDNIPTTNLFNYNIKAEREFKLAVLNWLNNGKPKLFSSPTEGNYIVRLMNVSLSPEQRLGRMLHSFSATAYESAECNSENMVDYGMVQTEVVINGETNI